MHEFLEVTLYVMAILAMFTFAVLCLYLVLKLGPLVRQIQSSLARTQETLEIVGEKVEPTVRYMSELKRELVPILRNMQETTKTSISISHKVDTQLGKTGEIVDEIAGIAERVSNLERDFEDRIVEPIRQIGTVVTSTSRAVKTFANVMAGDQSEPPRNGIHK